MKRIGLLAAIAAVGCCGYWAAGAQQAGPQPAEKRVTITEKQLEELVERRIAQELLEKKVSLDQAVVQGENWHTAIYNGVEYTVYTGPGQVLATRWAAPAPKTTPPPIKPEKSPATPGGEE